MTSLSDTKLTILQSPLRSTDDVWYITKQDCDFRNLCYIGQILSEWTGPENYENFFNRVKTTAPYSGFISRTAHRATKNLAPYGLMYPSGNYQPERLTPVFRTIQRLTGGDYSRMDLYRHIIDAQLEKMILNTDVIFISPIMYTLKILLLLGDVTGRFSMSIQEFKLFVATSRQWNDYFATVESIMRFRNDAAYRDACMAEFSKVAEVRYNMVVGNYTSINTEKGEIEICSGREEAVRRRVADYELDELPNLDPDTAMRKLCDQVPVTRTIQQILFGAPGVGKSHNLKGIYENEDDVVRITFHPETDYASFVGTYKPVMRADAPGEIEYRFQPQAFAEAYVEAWKRYVGGAVRKDVYLVIEEINRGNCAQIFGDIFQLLDRDDNGFSEYSIRPDKDLEGYLCDSFHDMAAVINSVRKDVGTGRRMVLPPNLHIIGTMNTSDQSLFPIDSAFKRRWDWVYMPIDTHPVAGGAEVRRTVVTESYSYDWGEFIDKVNVRIHALTLSEDKQLGFWFVKPGPDGRISAYDFVSKVIFYLWNDVYKDYADSADSIFMLADDGNPVAEEKHPHSFRDFTPRFGMVDTALVDAFMRNLGVAAVPVGGGDNPVD